jgi:serine kinase of HPr protein (carbohydrate metabolism regulator)
MNDSRLSSENLHASCVAIGGRAILLAGPSGSGKSDLALRLIDRGFTLVSDDRTIVSKEGERLVATAPATIKGKLEIRGIGIVDVDSLSDVPVALVVELKGDFQRMPDDSPQRLILGASIPLIVVDAMTASAVPKVVMGLERLGLRF